MSGRYYQVLMYVGLRISVALHKKLALKDRLYAGSYIQTSENVHNAKLGE